MDIKEQSIGSQTVLITEQGESISYAELLETADFLFCNQQEKSLVLILCTNTYECVTAYISCLRNHLVPILVSSQIREDAIAKMIEQYRPAYIFCPDSIKIEVLEKKYRHQKNIGTYQLMEIQENDKIAYEINSDLALLLTTSGSTGSSKLVRLSYRNLEANTESIIKYLKLTEKDRAITMLPMQYTYGLSVLNTHLKSGASVVLSTKSVLDKEFWKLVRTHNVTSLSGVPYTYEVLQKMRFHTMELKALRYLTAAGGKLTENQQQYLASYAAERNVEFYIMYGQTEATARIAYLPPEYALRKIGSTGISIPGGRIEIEHDTDEIVYYGKNVSMGYAESYHDLAKGDENQGVLHTGDTGYIDREGLLYITGRKDRYAKLLGHRIDLNDVEGFIKKTLGIGVVSMVTDESLVLYIKVNDVEKEYAKAETSRYLGINPKLILMRKYSELPRNEYGKVMNKG